MKKIALVAGMAIAVAATFTSCGNSNKKSDACSQKKRTLWLTQWVSWKVSRCRWLSSR